MIGLLFFAVATRTKGKSTGRAALLITALLLLSFFHFSRPVFLPGEEWTQIVGKVINREDGRELAGAQVQVLNTFIGDVTDQNGLFQISGLAPGHYRLRISYIGFENQEIDVEVGRSDLDTVTVYLEPTIIPLNQLVVIGSRRQETLERAAASVHVLNRREMAARRNFSLMETISYLPGVQIVGENLNIRGGSGYNRLGGSRVLVLLDEVPILTSDLNNVNWNLIPVTAVEQIEVLKGASSSLFGSGALSGVVDIRTKDPEPGTEFSFQQTVGVYDRPAVPEWKWTDRLLYYHRTDAGLNQQKGNWGLRADVSRFLTTGDREMGGQSRYVVTAKTAYSPDHHTRLSGFVTYSFEKRELFLRWLSQNRALEVPPADRVNRYRLSGFMGYLKARHLFSPKLSSEAWIAFNRQLLGVPMNLTSAFTPAIGWSGNLQTHWYPLPRHQITFGVDARNDRVNSKYYGHRQAFGISPYIHYSFSIGPAFYLDTGIRWDTYVLVGDSLEQQLSPRLGFSFQPFVGTTLHAAFGRAFRAASVVERFLSVDEGGDVRVEANPALPPENSTLFDVGIRQTIGRNIYFESTLFFSRFSNLIELTLIPSNLSVRFLTYPDAAVDGIENYLRIACWKNHLIFTAAATWMNPRYLETGRPLPYRSRFVGYLTQEVRAGHWRLSLDFRYASPVEAVLVYPKDERVPLKLWNVMLEYQKEKWKAQLLVKNAGNYHYTVSERVLGEIRNAALSVIFGL